MTKTLAIALTAALASSTLAAAQAPAPPPPHILRGSVLALAPEMLDVRTADGKVVHIVLAKDWTVQVTKPITAADIQAGSFIGTAEMPQADGTGRSLEVHVFPPGVKMGEGHYGWDLQKGSKMTNGTVGKVVSTAKGRELDVSYSTGQRHIVVPTTVPIVQIAQGDRSMIKAGVKVFIVAGATPTGALATNAVVVGVDGMGPPM